MTRQPVGSPGEQESAWCQPPFAGQHQSGGGLPLPRPLPCPYLMSTHHYLIKQNQGWRGGVQQQDDVHCLGQDKGQRLPAGHDETVRIRSSSAGFAKGWSTTSSLWPPTPQMNGRISSSAAEQACMKQQQVPSSRIPNLEISLGRQGWQNSIMDQQQQRQRSVESSASKELTLLKCL